MKVFNSVMSFEIIIVQFEKSISIMWLLFDCRYWVEVMIKQSVGNLSKLLVMKVTN